MITFGTKITAFSALVTIFFIAILFFNPQRKRVINIHDKVVFFRTDQQLLIIQKDRVVSQSIGAKNPSAILYQSKEKSTIGLHYLSHSLSANRDFLFFFEQTAHHKMIDLVIINLTNNNIFRFSLPSLPKNFNYIDHNFIFLYWPTGKALCINLHNNNITHDHLEPMTSVIALTPHHTVALKNNRVKKGHRSYALSADRQYIANYHKDGLVIKVDGTHHLLFTRPFFQKFLPLQLFSPDSKMLATVIGSQLIVTNLETRQQMWQKKFHSGFYGPLSLHYSPDGSKILVGGALHGQIGAIFIYDSSNGQLISRQLGAND